MARNITPESGAIDIEYALPQRKYRGRSSLVDVLGYLGIGTATVLFFSHGLAQPNPSVVPDGAQKFKRIDNPDTPDRLESRTAYAWCDMVNTGTLLVTDDQYANPELIKRIPDYQACSAETTPRPTISQRDIARIIFDQTS